MARRFPLFGFFKASQDRPTRGSARATLCYWLTHVRLPESK